MSTTDKIKTIKSIVREINFTGQSLQSVSDLTNDQIWGMFELSKVMEPWSRSVINLLPGSQMITLFFQPSTRTRMSFETAMHRLGGTVVTETTPMISSSLAKEESLNDSLKVLSKYANIIVLRHYDDVAAREAVNYSEVPVINGGWGHWEHPAQTILDLYTIWRTFGRIEGVNVCVASPDLIEARTGHSMLQGLVRFGANVTLASTSDRRTPEHIMEKVRGLGSVTETFDHTQDSFNELVAQQDYIYLPGCSQAKGPEAEAFKKLMDDYFVRFETLEKVRREENRTIYITHTLPRRDGEMDLRIDQTPSQLCFDVLTYALSSRMALVASILLDM